MVAAVFSAYFQRLSKGIALHSRTRDALLCLSAWGLPFLVYLRTLAPTVYGLDSAELTTGAYTLGIVHAPGSPAYLLIGHLFAWLPFGDVGYRLNLMSACATAITAVFIYLILCHLTGQRFIALISAWFASFTFYFWISAVAAELYSVNACFVAALLYLVLRWRQDGAPGQLYLVAFLFGFGLGIHMMLLLLLPGLGWLMLSSPHQLWRRPRWVFGAAFCAVLGASVYLYLPIRYLANPPFDYARYYWGVNLATWDGFVWMVTARMFSSLFFATPVTGLPSELAMYLYRLWSNFSGVGLLIGSVGLLAGIRQQRTVHIGLLLVLTLHLVFYLPYGATDKDTMFLPTFVIFAIWIGLGLDVCRQQIRHRMAVDRGLVPALTFVMTAGMFVLNFSYVDLSHDWRTRTWGESILSTVNSDAYYFGTWADVPILEYLQFVEGRRRDVTSINLYFTGREEGKRIAINRLIGGYPVYTSDVGLADNSYQLEYVSACQCYRAMLP